jgi:hypothetical protein
MPVKGTADERRAYNRAHYARNGEAGKTQVYALLGVDRKPKYVGASVSATARAKTHWQQRARRTTQVAAWLRSLDRMPEVWVIESVPTEMSSSAEQYWIDLLSGIPDLDLLNKGRAKAAPSVVRPRLSAAEISARLSAGQQRNIENGNGREQRRQAVLARWARQNKPG